MLKPTFIEILDVEMSKEVGCDVVRGVNGFRRVTNKLHNVCHINSKIVHEVHDGSSWRIEPPRAAYECLHASMKWTTFNKLVRKHVSDLEESMWQC